MLMPTVNREQYCSCSRLRSALGNYQPKIDHICNRMDYGVAELTNKPTWSRECLSCSLVVTFDATQTRYRPMSCTAHVRPFDTNSLWQVSFTHRQRLLSDIHSATNHLWTELQQACASFVFAFVALNWINLAAINKSISFLHLSNIASSIAVCHIIEVQSLYITVSKVSLPGSKSYSSTRFTFINFTSRLCCK